MQLLSVSKLRVQAVFYHCLLKRGFPAQISLRRTARILTPRLPPHHYSGDNVSRVGDDYSGSQAHSEGGKPWSAL